MSEPKDIRLSLHFRCLCLRVVLEHPPWKSVHFILL